MNEYLLIFGAAAAIALAWAWRVSDGSTRVVLVVFLGVYVLTTGIGAFLIGVRGVSVLDDLGYGLETRILTDLDGPLYWGMLLAPLIVTPVILLWPSRGRVTNRAAGALTGGFRDDVDLLSFWAVMLLFGGYCVVRFIQTGTMGAIGDFLDLRGDYESILVLRGQVLGQLGTFDCALVYALLPALAQCAMFQAARRKTWGWRLTFAAAFGLTALLSIAVMQKALILIFGVFLAVGLLELKVIRLRTLAVVALAAVIVLAGMEAAYVGEWSLGGTMDLLIFRMASSYPYYMNLYPRDIPYAGIQFNLDMLGLAPPIRDNLDVFDRMYPQTAAFIQGAAAAPAHVRAYAQAGVEYALLTLVVIAAILKLTAAVRRRFRGPLTFALYMQMLVLLYYLSQVSLRDSLLSSYGFLWSLVGLGAIVAARALGRLASRAAGALGKVRPPLTHHVPQSCQSCTDGSEK